MKMKVAYHSQFDNHNGCYCYVCGKDIKDGEQWIKEPWYLHTICLYRLARMFLVHKDKPICIQRLKIVDYATPYEEFMENE